VNYEKLINNFERFNETGGRNIVMDENSTAQKEYYTNYNNPKIKELNNTEDVSDKNIIKEMLVGNIDYNRILKAKSKTYSEDQKTTYDDISEGVINPFINNPINGIYGLSLNKVLNVLLDSLKDYTNNPSTLSAINMFIRQSILFKINMHKNWKEFIQANEKVNEFKEVYRILKESSANTPPPAPAAASTQQPIIDNIPPAIPEPVTSVLNDSTPIPSEISGFEQYPTLGALKNKIKKKLTNLRNNSLRNNSPRYSKNIEDLIILNKKLNSVKNTEDMKNVLNDPVNKTFFGLLKGGRKTRKCKSGMRRQTRGKR
jgi:hypothetical protein